ncbi:MAG: hypothetical protein Fur0018_06830 [Anaerolineales bacterium]
MTNARFSWWKWLSTWAVFLLLHFSFESFPNTLFRIIGEDGETNYFHMKMLFFAYIFTTLVEMVLRRAEIRSWQDFLTTRMMIAVTYPWMMTTFWFIVLALTGRYLPEMIEIIYSNIIMALGIYVALRQEEAFDVLTYRPALRYSIYLLFACAVLTYVVFSFNTPQFFFSTPQP